MGRSKDRSLPASPPGCQLNSGELLEGDCLPFAFLQVFKKCVLYSPTVFSSIKCPKTIPDVRQLLGAYFETIFNDIQCASSPADRITASSQFTREFGFVDGDPHDAIPLTYTPAEIVIPQGSIFDRPSVSFGRCFNIYPSGIIYTNPTSLAACG